MLFKDLVALVRTVDSEAADYVADNVEANKILKKDEWNLWHVFTWSMTPQGHEFWVDIEKRIKSEFK